MGLGALKGRNCSGGAFRSQAAQRAGMSSAITTASASLWSSTYAQRPWGRPGRARGGGAQTVSSGQRAQQAACGGQPGQGRGRCLGGPECTEEPGLAAWMRKVLA